MFRLPGRIVLLVALLGAATGHALAQSDSLPQRMPIGPPQTGAPAATPQAPAISMPEHSVPFEPGHATVTPRYVPATTMSGSIPTSRAAPSRQGSVPPQKDAAPRSKRASRWRLFRRRQRGERTRRPG